jgi:initiation factor 1A
MVKNTTGGTGTKGLARKHQSSGGSKGLRLPEDPDLERFGCVTKMFGNGMCEVTFNDKTTLLGHIRNKFRGKQKRHNMIYINTLVLAGLREWENPRKSCDIVEIYDEQHVEQLMNIPSIKIDGLLQARNGATGANGPMHDGLEFKEDLESALPEQQRVPLKSMEEEFDIVAGNEVNIDDI